MPWTKLDINPSLTQKLAKLIRNQISELELSLTKPTKPLSLKILVLV